MIRINGPANRVKGQHASAVRACSRFPAAVYGRLEEIAENKKVPLARVVRDAAERYPADRIPDRASRPGFTQSNTDGGSYEIHPGE